MHAELHGDIEQVDGWRCPHCQTHLHLASVREHVRAHNCPGCMIELLTVEAVLAEQRRRRLN